MRGQEDAKNQRSGRRGVKACRLDLTDTAVMSSQNLPVRGQAGQGSSMEGGGPKEFPPLAEDGCPFSLRVQHLIGRPVVGPTLHSWAAHF